MYCEKIIDIITGKEIIREYNKSEVEEAKQNELKAMERIKQNETIQELRSIALAKLKTIGLTEDEIAAL